MALHEVSDEGFVPFQSSPHLSRQGSVVAGRGAAGKPVEAPADAGEFAEQRAGRRVGPGPDRGAERGLADEAGRGEARAAGAFRDLPEFIGVEANQLGGGPAVDHGPPSGTQAETLLPLPTPTSQCG